MKMRLIIEVPLPPMEGEKPGEFCLALDHDTQRVERTLPREAVVTHAEYLPEEADARAVFKKLLRMKLEGAPLRGFKSSDYYEKGDEDQPFFSEAYLYPLLGKDDARTVLAYLHHLMKVFGLDPMMIEREINAEIAAEDREKKERVERVAKRRDFLDSYAAGKGWTKTAGTLTGYTDAQNLEMRKVMREAGL